MPPDHDDETPSAGGRSRIFRRRLVHGMRSAAATPEPAAQPAPPRPVEPAKPPSPTALPKHIVAPSARRGDPAALGRAPGRNLVVGRDIVLTGDIETCERLLIEGRVEGTVTETERLEIAESGRFKGTAEVATCVVAGACEGELTVNGLLTVRAKGRVSGKVRYAEVQIERGGRLSGEIEIQTVRPVPNHPAAGGEARETAAGDDSPHSA